MITTVLFDMGGTLEDIWVDEKTHHEAIARLDEMLAGWGLETGCTREELLRAVDEGWKRYDVVRKQEDVELKPEAIWCDYILEPFHFPREVLSAHAEEIAHMWEVTYYHRELRKGAKDMLHALKDMGLKLGVISNTAAMYQVFDSLEEYGIRDVFTDVTLSSVTGLRKPCRDIFTVSLREMQSLAAESVYVGDTVSRDVIGSKKAGFACAIQITSRLTREKDQAVAKAPEADYVITDIRDVEGIVRKLIS